MKFFELLIAIPVTLLSPQVRIKKLPPDFEKRGPQKKSLYIRKNFFLTF